MTAAVSDPTVIRVDPRYPGIWDDVRPYLDMAMKEGNGERDWSLDDVYEMTLAGEVQLWALLTDKVFGALVTTQTNYPKRRLVEVLLFGADAHSEPHWLKCLEQLKDMAKAAGATCLSGTGRPGWARKLKARSRLVWELDL